MRALLAVLLMVALAGVLLVSTQPGSNRAASPCGPVDASPAVAGIQAAGAATLCLLNEERRRRGLALLATDPMLTSAAQQHSEDMVRRGYFEHTTPEGVTVQDRIRASGWPRGGGRSTGENIEWGLRGKATPAAIVAKWMASPPHRADILRPAFRQIGIGIALGAPNMPGRSNSDGATYTTDFGGVIDPSLSSG